MVRQPADYQLKVILFLSSKNEFTGSLADEGVVIGVALGVGTTIGVARISAWS